jgi:hypothetical protein
MGLLLTKAGSSAGFSQSSYIFDGRNQTDTDALAFISAASITDAAQKNAIHFLVGGLKYYSLWTKMVACYPFVGGNATAHSKDLKAGYNITNVANATWTGMTHNSNGITGNGTTQYGDTGLVPSSALSLNSTHLSFYRRSGASSSEYDIGCGNGTVNLILLARPDGQTITWVNSLSASSDTVIGTTRAGVGFSLASRTGASTLGIFKNFVKIKAATTASSALPTTYPLYISGRNSVGSLANSSDANYSFFSIGSGLSDTDALNLSSIVQSYQTILGRAV